MRRVVAVVLAAVLLLSASGITPFPAGAVVLDQAPPSNSQTARGKAIDPNREGFAHPPIHVKNGATASYQKGYRPSQISRAYGFDQLAVSGSAQTIAIVDAYGSPTLENDLAIFNKQFGLPDADLTIAYPTGKPRKTDAGWALETSMDVQWSHALAPKSPILLVVARSSSLNDLLAAVDYATNKGARVVSMSWGGAEFSGETSYDYHFRHAGVVYAASAGDNGSGALWPAASPAVVSVGGTNLPLDTNGNRIGPETAWSLSGGGISIYEPEPEYQKSYGVISNSRRSIPDVSFDADPSTGVAVYDSTSYRGQKGWFVVGGTSLGAPAWASLISLADAGRTTPLTGGNAALYNLATGAAYPSNYTDVTTGTNGYSAKTGYDLVTGLGSPVANNLVVNLTRQ